jgi:dTDP-4-amino-4,6-dideoxygalactose transaminase
LNPSVPESERNAEQCLSLPMFAELTQDEVDYTVGKIREWDAQFGKD